MIYVMKSLKKGKLCVSYLLKCLFFCNFANDKQMRDAS
jgi:hypothetical protein